MLFDRFPLCSSHCCAMDFENKHTVKVEKNEEESSLQENVNDSPPTSLVVAAPSPT